MNDYLLILEGHADSIPCIEIIYNIQERDSKVTAQWHTSQLKCSVKHFVLHYIKM
jgi:hypothetical protein